MISLPFIRAVVVAVQVSVQADRSDGGLSDRVDQSVCLCYTPPQCLTVSDSVAVCIDRSVTLDQV